MHDNVIRNIQDVDNFLLRAARKHRTENQIAVFRGHADIGWKLEPSVFRDGLILHEASIIKECLNQYPFEFGYCKDTLGILTVMQHFGAATRLLDFTVDPYVSTYFACCKEFEKDATVSLLAIPFSENDSIAVQSICFYAQYNFSEDENRITFFDNLRFFLKRAFPDQYLESMINSVPLIIPPMTNERLKRQKGCFLLFGDDIDTLTADKITKKANEIENNVFCNTRFSSPKKFLIPSDCKKNILHDLEERGYNKEYLLPDEIETSFKQISDAFKTNNK